MGGWVYILANRPDGVLYVGVTAELGMRIHQHQEDAGSIFAKRYGVRKLVWMRRYENIADAIDEEKRIKRWRRAWKTRLIEESNPDWDDLYPTLNL